MLYRFQGLLHRVGGNTDDHMAPDPLADLGRRHILLAHMDAVCLAGNGNVHVVVDDEGYAVAAAQLPDFQGLSQKGFLAEGLFPELHTGYAALQRGLYLLGKALPAGPGPVGYGIEPKHLVIALHSLHLSPGSGGSYGRWRR